MHRFAFVIHPIKPKDAARKYPIARYMPDWVIEKVYGKKKPFVGSYIKGIESKTGAKTEGLFIICPLTPDMMLHKLPLEAVYEKLIYCSELAKTEGAEIMGLGAFTSVVGDGGITVANHSPIAITTGNSYTIATAIQGAMQASELVGIDLNIANLAVVGATGTAATGTALVDSVTTGFSIGVLLHALSNPVKTHDRRKRFLEEFIKRLRSLFFGWATQE